MTGPANVVDPYLLIDYVWYPSLDAPMRARLSDFSSGACAFDREAGFTSITVSEVGDLEQAAGHLVVHATDQCGAFAGERRLAAYLTVDMIDGQGVAEARLVVAPAHRSRGIATLLVEKLQIERAKHRWFGLDASRVRMVAAGSHPASLRLADRFGFTITGERWSLLAAVESHRVLSDPAARDRFEMIESVSPARVRGGVVHEALDSVDAQGRLLTVQRYFKSGANADTGLVVRHSIDGHGRPDATAVLDCGPDVESMPEHEIEALFDLVLVDLAARGARSVMADIDPTDIKVVRVGRRENFYHDQTNVVVEVELES